MTARRIVAGTWLVAGIALGSAPAMAARDQTLTATLGLTTLYDSNVLQYSDDQIALFEGRVDSRHISIDRFSIESRDDAVWRPDLGVGWELDAGHGRRHALRARAEGAFHQRDGTADFRSLGLGWRESWSHGRRLAVGWYALPSYYLRQLEDERPYPGVSIDRRATFDLGIASAGWSQRLTRGLEAGIAYQHERRDYAAPFEERSSTTHQFEASAGLRHLPRRGTLDLTGGWRASSASPSNAPAPHDVDVSYHGPIGAIEGRLELLRRGDWRLGADATWQIEARRFDSDRVTDRYHFGRHDLLNAVEVGLRAQLRPHWSARPFYRYEINQATLGSAAPPSADTGSYHEHQVGLRVEWSGNLWSGSNAEGEE